jgi:hypothetical protein
VTVKLAEAQFEKVLSSVFLRFVRLLSLLVYSYTDLSWKLNAVRSRRNERSFHLETRYHNSRRSITNSIPIRLCRFHSRNQRTAYSSFALY